MAEWPTQLKCIKASILEPTNWAGQVHRSFFNSIL